MPTVLAYVGGRGDSSKPLDRKHASSVIAEGGTTPHDDILITVETFRGAIRRGR
jgi:hypothetical protein